MVSSVWPLFDLTLTGPTLGFHYPRDEDLESLARIVDDVRRQPSMDWFWAGLNGEDGGLPSQARAVQQLWHWRASWTAANWMLPFAAVHGDQVVGVVEIYAQNFPVLRIAE